MCVLLFVGDIAHARSEGRNSEIINLLSIRQLQYRKLRVVPVSGEEDDARDVFFR